MQTASESLLPCDSNRFRRRQLTSFVANVEINDDDVSTSLAELRLASSRRDSVVCRLILYGSRLTFVESLGQDSQAVQRLE